MSGRFKACVALGLSLAFRPSILGVFVDAQDNTPEPRCKDCWCVPANGQACPGFEGLRESFPAEWSAALNSFQRIDSADVYFQPTDCFPFPSAVSQLDPTSYPQSAGPPCQLPVTPTDSAVCAFVFPNGGSSTDGNDAREACQGRSYRVQTFDNAEAALAHNNETETTLIVHQGVCGVCSNAADLVARIDTLDSMQSVSVLCAVDYAVTLDKVKGFANLVDCYIKNIKLSTPCATVWAHFGATNAALCQEECLSNFDENNKVILNDPETCALTECLECSASTFENDFNDIAGLYKSIYNAGVLDPVAYPCDLFYRIQDETWDPCLGAVPGPAIVETPAPSPSGTSTKLWSMAIVGVMTAGSTLLFV